MTAPPAVLVLTGVDDPHADDVILRLHERSVPVVRFDTGEFPMEARLVSRISNATSEWEGRIWRRDRPLIDLRLIRSVWYRRPQTFPP